MSEQTLTDLPKPQLLEIDVAEIDLVSGAGLFGAAYGAFLGGALFPGVGMIGGAVLGYMYMD